ncbi:hypothetical protein [Streptomyces sp. NPDC006879]|uniref:hypothetical protein n=1 Tax=Streptomyces sp. NPDC006879 TaxID=3364767 RepID=UPI0036B4956B
MTVRNRRAANWTLPANQWAAQKATRHVETSVRAWGYDRPHADVLTTAVTLLTNTVCHDGGKRVSIHLADQDGKLLVLALSHHPAPAPDGEEILTQLAALAGTVSCGSDAAIDGRRLWVLLDTVKPRHRAAR